MVGNAGGHSCTRRKIDNVKAMVTFAHLVEPEALALGKAMNGLFVCTGHGAFAVNPLRICERGAPVRLSAHGC